MKKIFKSLILSVVIVFSMTLTPTLGVFHPENINVVEAATKKTFKTFTVNSVYNSSTKITGKSTNGATIKVYVAGKQVSKSTIYSSEYVYANGGNSTSKIYHKTSTAHNMEGAIKMRLFIKVLYLNIKKLTNSF